MKTVNFIVGILFLLTICFSFLIVENNVVIGQTATTAQTCTELESSQTSYFNICLDNGYDNVCFDKFTGVYKGCTKNANNDCTLNNTNADQNILCSVIVSSTTTSGGAVTLSPKFTGIWKVKVKKPASEPTPTPSVSEPTPTPSSTTAKTCTELESSQTSYFNICSDNGYDNVCFDKFTSVYQGCTKNANNDCTESNTNAAQNILCSALTSKTPARKLLAHITDNSSGSNIITFKLCVREGKLEGTVHQGGAFLNGVITEQTIISDNEVEFTALSQDSKTTKMKLKLTGDRQLQVVFTDGHTLEGRKLNENRGCLAPGKGPKGPKGPSIEPTPSGGSVMGGPSMSEANNNSSGTVQPSMDTPPKPTPSIEPSMGGGLGEGGPSMTGPGEPEPGMAGNNEEGSGTEMSSPPPFAMGGSENSPTISSPEVPPTMDTAPESMGTPPSMGGMST